MIPNRVGVRILQWMTMEGERLCPIRGLLDEEAFDLGRFGQRKPHSNGAFESR